MGLFFNKKNDSGKQHYNNNFKMIIVDTFAMAGGNTVIVGTIESGACRVGEGVTIHTRYGVITSTIAGLEAYQKRLSMGYAGQRIGILLKDVSKDQISKDDIVMINNAGIYS